MHPVCSASRPLLLLNGSDAGAMRTAVFLVAAALLLPLCRAACECTYTNTDFECPTIGPEGNKTVGCELGVRRLYRLFLSTAKQACAVSESATTCSVCHSI